MCFTSFPSFLNDFQSIGACPPPTVRSHQNQQTLVKHICFDIKMSKQLILPAFPAFLLKIKEIAVYYQLFQLFLTKTKEKAVYYQLFQLFEWFSIYRRLGTINNANRWKIIQKAGKAGNTERFLWFLIEKAGKAGNIQLFLWFLIKKAGKASKINGFGIFMSKQLCFTSFC